LSRGAFKVTYVQVCETVARHKRHHIFAVSASAFDGFRLGLLLLDFLLLHRQRCICGAARPTRRTGATPTGETLRQSLPSGF
jgi:hypothetical protein